MSETLFDIAPARSRRRDPVTSRQAAELMTRTGAAESHAALVLDVLREHPGQTYRELSRHVTAFGAVAGKACTTWEATI